MKALPVYPEHPSQTYWSFSGALPLVEARCNRLRVPVVAGGPYPSSSPEPLTRDALRRARRKVWRPPEEYRRLGTLELQALRRCLDDFLPGPAAND